MLYISYKRTKRDVNWIRNRYRKKNPDNRTKTYLGLIDVNWNRNE